MIKAKNYILSILNTLVKTGVVFVIGVILARHLTQEDYGQFYLKLQVVNFSSILLAMGLGQGLLSEVKKGGLHLSEAYSVLIAHVVFVSIFGLFLINIYCFIEYQFLLFLGTLLALAVQILSFLSMNSLLGIRKNLISSIGTSLLYLVVGVLAILMFNSSYIYILVILFCTYLIRILWLFEFGSFSLKLKINSTIYRRSLPFFFNALLLTGLLRLDVFILNDSVSSRDIALYGVSLTIAEVVTLIPAAIGSVIFPSILNTSSSDSQRSEILRVLIINVLIAFCASVLLFFAGERLIVLIYGSEYIESSRLLKWLLPGVIALSVTYSISNAINAKGGVHFGAKILLFGVLINIMVIQFFIDDYGLIIGPVSSSIAYSITGLLFIISGFRFRLW